MFLKDKEEGKR